jgi:hypothetical protein
MSKKDLTKSILQRILGKGDDISKTVNPENLLDAQVAKEVKAAQEAQDALKTKEKLAKQYDEALNAEKIDKIDEAANFTEGPSVAETFQMRGYPKSYEQPKMTEKLSRKNAQEMELLRRQNVADLAKTEEAGSAAMKNFEDPTRTLSGQSDTLSDITKTVKASDELAEAATAASKDPMQIVKELPDAEKGKVWKFMKDNPGVSLIAALGAVGAGSYAFKKPQPGSVQQVPPEQAQGLPEGVEPTPEAQPEALQQAVESTPSVRNTSSSSVQASSTEAPDSLESDPLMQEPPQESDIQKQLQSAMDRRDNERLMGGLGQSLATISAGAIGTASKSDVKPVYTGFEDTMKNADRHLKDFATKLEAEKSDPKSQTSQNFRDFLKQFKVNIPESMSAEQAAKIMPYAYQKYAQEEAAKARKELAYENRLARRELAEMSASQKEASKAEDRQKYDAKLARDLRKDATSGEFGKMFTMYNTAKRTSDAFAEFLKNPSGYKDFATLMGGLKVLQGDDSVVREAEMRLGMQATSTINKALNYAQRFATGKTLQDSQRKEMVETIRILQNAAKNNYKRAVQPIVYQAKEEGVDLRNLFDKDMAEFLDKPIDDSQSAPLELSTSRDIKIRNKSNGQVLKFNRQEADKLLTSSNFEEVK